MSSRQGREDAPNSLQLRQPFLIELPRLFATLYLVQVSIDAVIVVQHVHLKFHDGRRTFGMADDDADEEIAGGTLIADGITGDGVRVGVFTAGHGSTITSSVKRACSTRRSALSSA